MVLKEVYAVDFVIDDESCLVFRHSDICFFHVFSPLFLPLT